METNGLFPHELPSEKIVKMTFVVLCANLKRDEALIRETISNIPPFQIQELAAYYDELMEQHKDQKTALAQLSKYIADALKDQR